MADKKSVAKTSGKEMAQWEDRLAEYAKESSKSETPSASYISLKSGVLSYEGNPVPDNKLQVIVLDSAFENTFYATKYDPNNLASPKCFSIDHDNSGMVPHDLSEDKQSETCLECPMLKWGSKEGSRGKACQERRRLICIPATVESADEILTAEVAVMKVPVTSVKIWATYVNTLDAMYKRPPFAMITELATVPDQKTQFKLVLNPVESINMEWLDAIIKKREMSQDILLKPYDRIEDEEAAKPKEDTKYA